MWLIAYRKILVTCDEKFYYMFVRLVVFSALFFLSLSVYADRSVALSFYKERLQDPKTSREDKIAFADSVIKYEPDNAEVLLVRANILRDLNRLDEAVRQMAVIKKSYFKKLPLRDRLALLYDLSGIYLRMGRNKDFAAISNELLETDKPDSLKHFDYNMYVSIFDNWCQFNRVQDAARYLRKIEQTYKTLRKKKAVSPSRLKTMTYSLYCDSMLYNIIAGNVAKALQYGAEAKNFCSNYSDSLRLSLNIAKIYDQNGESELAETYYKAAFSQPERIDKIDIPGAVINYMAHFNYRDLPEKSLELADRFGEDVKKSCYGDMIYSFFLKNKAVSLALAGDFENAYNVMGEAKGYTDSIFSSTQFSHSMADFELAMLEADRERMAANRLHWIVWSIVGLVVCVALLFVILIIRRKNSGLKAKTEKIQADTRTKTRQLATITMDLNRLSEQLSALRESVADRSLSDKEKVDVAANMLKDIRMQSDVSELSHIFFEESNEAFFRNLYTRHPDLTKGDIRLCSFLLMNLTNKEIATLLNRSDRTIETAKYRLSKKLNLPPGTRLEKYLHGFYGEQQNE